MKLILPKWMGLLATIAATVSAAGFDTLVLYVGPKVAPFVLAAAGAVTLLSHSLFGKGGKA